MATTDSKDMVEVGGTATQDAIVDSYTTSFHPAEIGLSDTSLPNILFMLEPSTTWGTTAIRAVLNNNGRAMTDKKGFQIRDFDFLPTRISIRPETWRLLLYTDRSHPLCGARDLQARMWPGEGETLLQANAMNMQKTRLRNALNVPCWVRRGSEPAIVECLIHEQYSYASVCLNTTLHVGRAGLVKPVMPDTIAMAAPEVLPLTEFLHSEGRHEPSARLQKIFQTIAGLQDIAFEKGYAHWIFLENRHKLQSWISKAERQRRPLTRPDEISLPRTEAMPQAAVAWIESCIRDTVGDKGEGFLPAAETLPKHAMLWVERILGNVSEDTSPAMNAELEIAEGRRNTLSEIQEVRDINNIYSKHKNRVYPYIPQANTSYNKGTREDENLKVSDMPQIIGKSEHPHRAAASAEFPMQGISSGDQPHDESDAELLARLISEIGTEALDETELTDDLDLEAYDAELDAILAKRSKIVPDLDA
ncbi:hypothetical protein MMC27_005178 [Xylographa pallens]|nr:hypothetical protein [Xylographa pallens]